MMLCPARKGAMSCFGLQSSWASPSSQSHVAGVLLRYRRLSHQRKWWGKQRLGRFHNLLSPLLVRQELIAKAVFSFGELITYPRMSGFGSSLIARHLQVVQLVALFSNLAVSLRAMSASTPAKRFTMFLAGNSMRRLLSVRSLVSDGSVPSPRLNRMVGAGAANSMKADDRKPPPFIEPWLRDDWTANESQRFQSLRARYLRQKYPWHWLIEISVRALLAGGIILVVHRIVT